MSIYYVSAAGNDALDGLTPETAWKTIPKVNQSIAGGDEVRFHCGDTFYGHIQPPRGLSPEQPTTYTSYGTGEKPEISQYKMPRPEGWEQHAPHIWKINMAETDRYTGNIYDTNANAGFIRVSGKIYPHKRFQLEDLAVQWDFYNDESVLYVWSETNPALLSEEICIACRTCCMSFVDCLRVTNLVFRGTGAHGINGVVNHGYIADCEFHEIGGSELVGYRTPNTRYGNGVECWSNSSNVTVERCKFSGIYDVAITMQGNKVVKSWENMYFRNNIMWNNQQCFEIWSVGDVPNTGFVNCHFEDNICIDSGYCWGYAVRPNKACSSHLLMYGLQCPLCDITVKGNLFVNARVATIFKSGGASQIPKDYKVVDNIIVRPAGQDIAWRDKDSDESYNAFEKMILEHNKVYNRCDYADTF